MTGTYLDELPETMRPKAPEIKGSSAGTVPAMSTGTYLDELPEPMRPREGSDRGTVAARVAEGTGEDVFRLFARTGAPFITSGVNYQRAKDYDRARGSIASGTGTDREFDTVAQYEALQQRDAKDQESLAGTALHSGLGLVRIAGEMEMGGALLRGAGMFTTPSANLAQAAKRVAAVTAAAPSMYTDKWIANNQEQGRDPADIRGMPSALAQGMAYTAILGSLGNLGERLVPGQGVGNFALRQAVRGLAGAGESQGADIAAGLLTDQARKYVPEWVSKETHYGPIGLMAEGKYGEAAKAATVTAMTFALLGGTHEIAHGRPAAPPEMIPPTGEKFGPPGTALVGRGGAVAAPEQVAMGRPQAGPAEPRVPNEVMVQFGKTFEALKKQGLSDKAAGEKMLEIGNRLNAAVEANPALTRQEAQALYAKDKGALRDLGLAFTLSRPDIAGQLEGPTKGPFHQPSVSQRPVTDPSVLRSMDARRQAPGTQAQQPAAPTQAPAGAAPSPRERVVAMESRHKELIGQVMDAGRNEKAAADRVKMGFPEKRAHEAAKARHKELKTELKRLERELDAARTEAARQPPEAPQAATPAEPAVPPAAPEIAPQTPPQEAQASSTLETVAKSFPNARNTPRQEIEAEMGGRKLYVKHDAERNVTRIDFEGKESGVPANLQKGSMDLMRGIRSLIGDLSKQGVGIEYRAVDTNRGSHKQSRADIYARWLKDAGYELVSEKGGIFVWRPAAPTESATEYRDRLKGLVSKKGWNPTQVENAVEASGAKTAEEWDAYAAEKGINWETTRTKYARALAEAPLPKEAAKPGEASEPLPEGIASKGLSGLSPEQRDVIERRLEGETLEQIAESRGVTREAIRRMEQRALSRLGVEGSVAQEKVDQQADEARRRVESARGRGEVEAGDVESRSRAAPRPVDLEMQRAERSLREYDREVEAGKLTPERQAYWIERFGQDQAKEGGRPPEPVEEPIELTPEQKAFKKRFNLFSAAAQEKLLKLANEERIDPLILMKAVEGNREAEKAGIDEHNAMLREARDWLGKAGKTIGFERVEEPSDIRGFDEAATAMAERYPTILGSNPEQKLFDLLKAGNLKAKSLAEHIDIAAEQIREGSRQVIHRESPETSEPQDFMGDDSFEFGANAPERQAEEIPGVREGNPIERLNALTEEHVQDPYRTPEEIRSDVMEILKGMSQQEIEATADQFIGIVKATADQPKPAADRLPVEAGGLNPAERAALDRLGAGEATAADNAMLDGWLERANKILAEARKFFAAEEGSLRLPEPAEERVARAAIARLEELTKNVGPAEKDVYREIFAEKLIELHDKGQTAKESVAPDVQNLMDRAGVRPGEQEALTGLLQGKSTSEVGRALGISKEAAWKRQQEAIRRIRVYMGAERGRDWQRAEADAFAHVKALQPKDRAALMEEAGVSRQEAQSLNALLKTESTRAAGKLLGLSSEPVRKRSNEALRKIKEVIGEGGPPNVVGHLKSLDAKGRVDLFQQAGVTPDQAKAMDALLAGKSIDVAGKEAGLDRTTIWKRQQEATRKISAVLGGTESRSAADVLAELKKMNAQAIKDEVQGKSRTGRRVFEDFDEREAKKFRGASSRYLQELEAQARKEFDDVIREEQQAILRGAEAGGDEAAGRGAEGNATAGPAAAGATGRPREGRPSVQGRIADAARRLIEDESGALNFGHLIQRVKDLLRKEKGTAPSGKDVVPDQSHPNPRLQPRDVSKQIYATPRGAGRIPGVGRLIDPRVGADEIQVALITREGEVKFGESVGELNRHTMPTPKTLIAGEDGKIPLADGTRDFPSDVAEREYKNPGSQKLFPEQREWLKKQKVVLDDNVAMTREEGVKKFVDADGNAIPLDEYSPRLAIGKQDLPPPTARGATGPGATPGSMKSRHYATEAEGYAAGVRYHPDMGVRLAKRIADGYKAAADYRLATDPVLQGEGFHKYKWLEKHRTVAAPAFRMRIFPREIADRLDAWYGERIPQLGRNIDAANAVQKALQFSGDVSNFTVQLMPMMWRHPKQWWEAVKGGARAFVSEEFQSKYLSKPENQAAANALIQSGSSRGYVDYMVGLKPGEILTKVPIAGKAFEAFGRLFTTSIDIAKIELWKKLAPQFQPQEYGDIAEYIDNAVGVGRMETIGIRPVRGLAERLVTLAPTYYRSQANLIGEAFQRGATGRQTRQMLGAMALGTAATAALLMKFYAKLDNDEIARRMNPQNGTFLKVPVTLSDGSKVEVGFGGMLLSLVRLAGDLSETSESDSPLNTGVHNNQILRWVRNHSSATVGLGMELFMGEEHGRSPGDVGTLAAKRGLPVTAQKAIFQEGTAGQAVGNSLFSFLGLNSFDESKNAPYLRALEDAAKKQGKSYKNMTIQEKARAIKVVERSGVKKPEMNESQKRLAIAREADRRSALLKRMKATTRNVLEEFDYKVPGYSRTVNLMGVDVPIDDAQTKLYERILAEEYDRSVERWNVEALRSAAPAARTRIVKKSLEKARERATSRLRAELGRGRGLKFNKKRPTITDFFGG